MVSLSYLYARRQPAPRWKTRGAALNARDISWRRRCSARPKTWEQKVQQKVLGRRPVRLLGRATGATLMLDSAGGGTRVSAPAGIALCDWMAYVSRYCGQTWVR